MIPIALFGLSGVGKTTLAHGVADFEPQRFAVVPITTSRSPRTDDDPRYVEFLSKAEFISSVAHDEKGFFKAQAFALETRNVNIVSIVSSPLNRALQTAKEIYSIHPSAQFHVVAELAERGWGELEGMSNEEMYAIERLEEEDPFYTPDTGNSSNF